MVCLEIKFLIKLRRFQNLHDRKLQRKLEMKQKIWDLIEKYQENDLYLQKKDSKILVS